MRSTPSAAGPRRSVTPFSSGRGRSSISETPAVLWSTTGSGRTSSSFRQLSRCTTPNRTWKSTFVPTEPTRGVNNTSSAPTHMTIWQPIRPPSRRKRRFSSTTPSRWSTSYSCALSANRARPSRPWSSMTRRSPRSRYPPRRGCCWAASARSAPSRASARGLSGAPASEVRKGGPAGPPFCVSDPSQRPVSACRSVSDGLSPKRAR
jgi:hypothetical protein